MRKRIFKEVLYITVFIGIVMQDIVLYSEAATEVCSIEKDVLKNIAKFTGKHLRQSLFFNKVAGLRLCIKKHVTTASNLALLVNIGYLLWSNLKKYILTAQVL